MSFLLVLHWSFSNKNQSVNIVNLQFIDDSFHFYNFEFTTPGRGLEGNSVSKFFLNPEQSIFYKYAVIGCVQRVSHAVSESSQILNNFNSCANKFPMSTKVEAMAQLENNTQVADNLIQEIYSKVWSFLSQSQYFLTRYGYILRNKFNLTNLHFY